MLEMGAETHYPPYKDSETPSALNVHYVLPPVPSLSVLGGSRGNELFLTVLLHYTLEKEEEEEDDDEEEEWTYAYVMSCTIYAYVLTYLSTDSKHCNFLWRGVFKNQRPNQLQREAQQVRYSYCALGTIVKHGRNQKAPIFSAVS